VTATALGVVDGVHAPVFFPARSIVVGLRNPETAAPPADLEARRIQVTLAASGPRHVSADLEFAVWAATIGESCEGEPVTLAGPLGHVTAGEQLVCSGAFSQHPRYGWQFSVESFRSALPRSPEGVVRWLTARVSGIGPAFARAIVNHFGAQEVFAELDRRPERLREVRTRSGRPIPRKSVERAIAAWGEVARIREVETFLFTHGVSAGLAARLVRRYGDEVVAVLTHDPYRLVELPRVGFKIADGIARSLGVELEDPQRLRAGLRFVLEDAESDGNTFLPLTELWQRAGTMLGVGELDPLESALRALVVDSEVVVEGERVYRVELWETDCRLAEIVGEQVSAEAVELFEQPERPAVDVSNENGRSSSSSARGRLCS
jgi:exodeoxyribonuclease V alpha subunit